MKPQSANSKTLRQASNETLARQLARVRKKLAKNCDFRDDMDRLPTHVAAVLSEASSVELPSLTRLTTAAAKHLANVPQLRLDGIQKLSLGAAKTLARGQGLLTLNSINGRCKNDARVIEQFVGFKGELHLNGIEYLPPAIIEHLAMFGGNLALNGLRFIDRTDIDALTRSARILELNRSTEFTADAVEALKHSDCAVRIVGLLNAKTESITQYHLTSAMTHYINTVCETRLLVSHHRPSEKPSDELSERLKRMLEADRAFLESIESIDESQRDIQKAIGELDEARQVLCEQLDKISDLED